MSTDLCQADDDCPNAASYGGLCSAHIKRRQRGQAMTAPIAKKPQSALERLREAALTYAGAEEDDEYERADDNLRKSAAAYAKKGTPDAIRAGLADARARGVRLGRPRKVDPADVENQIARHGSVKRAAVALGVTTRTIRNARRVARMSAEEAA